MNYNLQDRLIDFSVKCCDLAESLPNTRAAIHLADHLIRSAISPSWNYSEATSAESRSDFIHKMKVCLKELRETLVCMRITSKKDLQPKGYAMDELMKENDELIAIFHTSISTAKSNKTLSPKVKKLSVEY